MSGTEFYRQLREIRPKLAGRFVFVTGHAGEYELEETISRWHVPVVKKPFSMARLCRHKSYFMASPMLRPAQPRQFWTAKAIFPFPASSSRIRLPAAAWV